MRATEKYLRKVTPNIQKPTSPQLGIIVTIPAFNESETIKSLDALLDCNHPDCDIEILVNVNYSANAFESHKKFNELAYEILNKYAKYRSTDKIQIHILKNANQNPKKAGVGLARKQLMDEAYCRLHQIGNLNGIITGFDADSDCEKNYFTAIYDFFHKTDAKACSIRFAHPINGHKYTKEIYDAVALYELHIRSFIYLQKQIGSPYAYQTIGSSFAVTAEAYAQVNGMSPNKAGEDFYFLQGVMALGKFYQLNTTCIYPSSRTSNRVGFGTGPSVTEISSSGIKNTFSYEAYMEIKKLFRFLPEYYEKNSFKDLAIHSELKSYLNYQKMEETCIKFKQNFKSYERFKKAFFEWFNGFKILKALNLLSNVSGFEQEDVRLIVKKLDCIDADSDFKEDLNTLRKIDAQEPYYQIVIT